MIEAEASVYGRALAELDKTIDQIKTQVTGVDFAALERNRHFTRIWIFAIEARSVPSPGSWAGLEIHLNGQLREVPIQELHKLFTFLGFMPEKFFDLRSVHFDYDDQIGAKGGARCTFTYGNGARVALMTVASVENESPYFDNAVRIIKKCLADQNVAEPPPVDVQQVRAQAEQAFADLDELLR